MKKENLDQQNANGIKPDVSGLVLPAEYSENDLRKAIEMARDTKIIKEKIRPELGWEQNDDAYEDYTEEEIINEIKAGKNCRYQ